MPFDICRRLILPISILVTVLWMLVGGVAADHHLVTAEALAQRIANGTAPYILDVRTAEEYASGHVPGAVNIPYDELPARLDELPSKSDELLVYCRTGRRAAIAEESLRANGYTRVLELEGHWLAWPKN